MPAPASWDLRRMLAAVAAGSSIPAAARPSPSPPSTAVELLPARAGDRQRHTGTLRRRSLPPLEPWRDELLALVEARPR